VEVGKDALKLGADSENSVGADGYLSPDDRHLERLHNNAIVLFIFS
jgi:hypothetical protein